MTPDERREYQRLKKQQYRAQAKAEGKTYGTRGLNKKEKQRLARRHDPKRTPEKPTFVALDGEGTNREDGSQDYTLLCAATLSGQLGRDGAKRSYLENYRSGLSTEECLRFLIELGYWQQQTLVSFFFNYDVTKILHDLPAEMLAALWHGGWVLWAAPESGIVYYIKWMPSKIFEVAEYIGPAHIEGKINKTKDLRNRVTVYDTSGFFQCSFVKALKDWNIGEDTGLEFIATMKGRRNDFAANEAKSIRQYCFAECINLVLLMNKLADALWAARLFLRSWHGAGAIASELFAVHDVKRHNAPLPPEVEHAALGAYFGGRTEMFRQGEIPEGCFNYDLQSAYPSAAITLPSLKDAEWTHISHSDPSLVGSSPHALWRVSWDVTERVVDPTWIPSKSSRTRYRRITRHHLGPLPFRHQGRVYFPLRAGPTWVHGVELQVAMSLYGQAAFTLHEGWLLTSPDATLPFEFLRQVATDRIAYKQSGDMRHIPLKLGMNSVYGKLAQGQVEENREPPYLNYYWAGLITARTRATMLAAAFRAGDSLVAIATDGLFCTRPVDGLPLGKTPGTWEESTGFKEPTIVLQAGVMYSSSGTLRKTRGFGKMTLTYEEVRNEWRDKDIYGVVCYRERRFVGVGASVSTNNYAACGRWVERERKLKFYSSTKFYADTDGGQRAGITFAEPDAPFQHSRRLIPADCAGLASEPFVKPALLNDAESVELAAMIDDLKLAKIEHAEQPDWVSRHSGDML